jgi:hypothetical protein
MTDSQANPITEDLDANSADPGGVPFDDELPDTGDDADAGRGDGPAYDSAKLMQQRGIAYPAAIPQGMNVLKDFVMGHWGGHNLGILSKPPRPIRGGTTASLHNWGMAWDWRWADPGPGRANADAVIEYCINNAAATGIQAVHDYAKGRYWHSNKGWRDAKPSASTGFGQPWAQWLHIERTWAAANLATPLDQAPPTTPPTAKTNDAITGQPNLILPSTSLEVGSVGADVARLQDFLRYFKFADFKRSDGQYGPRTKGAVQNAQTDFAGKKWYLAKVDGQWGPKSNAAAAEFIKAALAASK